MINPQAEAAVEARAPEPRNAEPRNPEPRGPVLRDSDGGSSDLPDFLRASRAPAAAPEGAAEEKPARPRRRRAPRSFDAGEGAPPSSESEEA